MVWRLYRLKGLLLRMRLRLETCYLVMERRGYHAAMRNLVRFLEECALRFLKKSKLELSCLVMKKNELDVKAFPEYWVRRRMRSRFGRRIISWMNVAVVRGIRRRLKCPADARRMDLSRFKKRRNYSLASQLQ